MSVHPYHIEREARTAEIMRALESHIEGEGGGEEGDRKYGAPSAATLLNLARQYGPAIIQFVMSQVPAGTSVAKYIPAVLGILDVLKANGLLPAAEASSR